MPGRKAGYHVATSWYILAELVRRLDGRAFPQYVREAIFEPLGMEDTSFVVPEGRERMIGYGIASSLVHEVGHQGAALLDLVASVQAELHASGRRSPPWRQWSRWISEIVADQWSISRIGIGSTSIFLS